MIKRKQLEELGKSFNDLIKFPRYISHPKIDYEKDSSDLVWKPITDPWELSIGVDGIRWRVSYELYGWEGVDQRLPNTIETFFEGGGIYDESLQVCIQKMKEWLESEGLLK